MQININNFTIVVVRQRRINVINDAETLVELRNKQSSGMILVVLGNPRQRS